MGGDERRRNEHWSRLNLAVVPHLDGIVRPPHKRGTIHVLRDPSWATLIPTTSIKVINLVESFELLLSEMLIVVTECISVV